MAEARRVFDGTFFALLAALAALAAAVYARGGGELVGAGLGDGARQLLRYAPMLVLSFLAAALLEHLIPHEWVRARLGDDSGTAGVALGVGLGMLTPAGPFVSIPLAAMLIRAGAGVGPVVAFVSGWGLLALHRFVAWEVPLLGWRFALLRYAVCLLLPLAAGLLARGLVR
jgi:uncharacterized membrane protein YraQ (UPF0718 family)